MLLMFFLYNGRLAVCSPRWNDAVQHETAQISKQNVDLLQKWVDQELSDDELIKQWVHPPKPMSARTTEYLARKFLKERKWSRQSANTSGNYLDYDDPKMQQILGCSAFRHTHTIRFFCKGVNKMHFSNSKTYNQPIIYIYISISYSYI